MLFTRQTRQINRKNFPCKPAYKSIILLDITLFPFSQTEKATPKHYFSLAKTQIFNANTKHYISTSYSTEKYKAYILKYKPYISKYMACIFHKVPCVFLR